MQKSQSTTGLRAEHVLVFMTFLVGHFAEGYDLTTYFEKKSSEITWANRIWRHEELEKALEGSADMIESFVMSNRGHKTPVMGPHQAHSDHSGLKLDEFLDAVKNYVNNRSEKKGVLLRIGSNKMVPLVYELLAKKNEEIKFPVWIGADIIGSRNDSYPRVDYQLLFDTAANKYPSGTLCLGWAGDDNTPIDQSSYESNGFTNREEYNENDEKEMAKSLSEISDSLGSELIISVRAGPASRSIKKLKALQQSQPRTPRLYLWSYHEEDSSNIDVTGLKNAFRHAYFNLGIRRNDNDDSYSSAIFGKASLALTTLLISIIVIFF